MGGLTSFSLILVHLNKVQKFIFINALDVFMIFISTYRKCINWTSFKYFIMYLRHFISKRAKFIIAKEESIILCNVRPLKYLIIYL